MKCPHNPKETTGPIGMYHCPDCGDMVLAGMDHPDYDDVEESYKKYLDEKYESLKHYMSNQIGEGFHSLVELMETKQQVKAVLMEIWLRCDINEDHKCGFCNRDV